MASTAVLAPKDKEALVKIEELTKDLATIQSVSEIKNLADRTALLQGILQKSNASTEAINACVVAKAKIGRRGGEILASEATAEGGRPSNKTLATMARVSVPTLQERLGTKTQATARHIAERWAALLKITLEKIEELAEQRDAEGALLELTMRAIYEEALGLSKKKEKAEGNVTVAQAFQSAKTYLKALDSILRVLKRAGAISPTEQKTTAARVEAIRKDLGAYAKKS